MKLSDKEVNAIVEALGFIYDGVDGNEVKHQQNLELAKRIQAEQKKGNPDVQ
jgi:hypothetical protein